MKYVLLADLHLGLHNDSDVWHKVSIDLAKEISDCCVKNNINNICVLGDFFHVRKSTNVKTQNIAHQIVNILSDFHLTIIIGNHDIYFKNTIQPTSLEMLKEYSNVTIIDKTTINGDIAIIPWLGDIPEKTKYCFGHFEINGFHMNDNYICKKGIKATKFSDFKQCLSGHFHTPSRQGNITYLGAPYQQTFHDASGKRGYYTWEDGNLQFIEFHKYPKFHKVNTDDEITRELIEGNIIKLIFNKDYGTNENERIVNEVKSFSPLNLKVDFSNIANDGVEVELRDEDLSLINHSEIIDEYVKKTKIPMNIKKKVLMNIVKNMIEKLKEK